ncbi:MAG: TraK family protein [Methylococcaceae bacterium]|nr:TraK family protein [Methylococcaceae bacterium]
MSKHVTEPFEKEDQQILASMEDIKTYLSRSYTLEKIYDVLFIMKRLDMDFKLFNILVTSLLTLDKMQKSLKSSMESIDREIQRYHSYNKPRTSNLPSDCHHIEAYYNLPYHEVLKNSPTLQMTVKLNEKKEKVKLSGAEAVKYHEQEIRDCLKLGFSKKDIFEGLIDPILMPICYNTFIKYVKKFIIDIPQPIDNDYQSKYHTLC